MIAAAKREELAVGKRKSRMRDTNALTSEAELKEKQKQNIERLEKEVSHHLFCCMMDCVTDWPPRS